MLHFKVMVLKTPHLEGCKFLEGSNRTQQGVNFRSGLRLLDFESENSALWMDYGATVTLDSSTLSRNYITGTLTNNAVVSVNARGINNINAQQQNTVLRLQQCTLAGNSGPNIFVAHSWGGLDVEVYSDVERDVFFTKNDAMGTTTPLSMALASTPGINASSPWFIDVKQVRMNTPRVVPYSSTSMHILPNMQATFIVLHYLLSCITRSRSITKYARQHAVRI